MSQTSRIPIVWLLGDHAATRVMPVMFMMSMVSACSSTSSHHPTALTAAASPQPAAHESQLSTAGSTPETRPDAPSTHAEPRATGSTARAKRRPPAPSPAKVEPDEVAGITAAHNRARAELKLPPLTWSTGLAAVASEWADRLAARGCDLQHRSDGRYGENLYAIFGTTATADEVVSDWAAEVTNYDYKKNRCKGVCGHYTQVVWRNTAQLGCALARCGEGEVWVCNYDPPGNFVGERPY